MVELRGYIDENGNKLFANWLEELDASAAAKVAIALTRMEQGNFSKTKGVGAGVYEYKIDFGPGYRIYFGKDGQTLMILLGRRHTNAGPITNEERNRRSSNASYP